MKEDPVSYNNIILFDGVCNFCNSSINLVIRNDKKDLFRFAPLQSEIGKQLLEYYKVDALKTDSVVYITGGKAYTRSSAVLRIARRLKGVYPLLFGFMIIPPFLRNRMYDYIAKNRYKWFGKMDSCMVPTPEVRQKFISSF